MTKERKTLASICRWTVNTGEKGFTNPMRPSWGAGFTGVDFVNLIARNVVPNMPPGIEAVGLEWHYDGEINERTAPDTVKAMTDNGIYLSMITPGAHKRFSFGGAASLDDQELAAAREFGNRTVGLAYGSLAPAWHPQHVPTLVLWNGSFGYDVHSPGVSHMKDRLVDSVEGLCRYELKAGGKLEIAVEPKPNEGHGKMLLQTAGDVVALWTEISRRGLDTKRYGANLEKGHSDMVSLDSHQDEDMVLRLGMGKHYHANSQGYSDGVSTGGPGMFDVDHDVKVDGQTISIAYSMMKFAYDRWVGHDFQARHHDNEVQGVNRIISSLAAWEACKVAAASINMDTLLGAGRKRDTQAIADMMREAIAVGNAYYNEVYRPISAITK